MERTEIRLEILKLTHSFAYSADEAIGRAKRYEAYLTEQESGTEEAKAPAKNVGGRKPQKIGNPDPLS